METSLVSNSIYQKVLIALINTPLRKIKWLRSLFCKSYNIPKATVFSHGFKCNGPMIVVGQNVILGSNLKIYCRPAKVFIGDNTMFSHNNTIITSTHDLIDRNIIKGYPVHIGKNVWITSNVTILPGVNIGDNSVIGAGSVVTKDIPSNVFAAGNPCKVIKKIEIV
jgi:acetyltransferase-like isoleucine patch superfamily enzyme